MTTTPVTSVSASSPIRSSDEIMSLAMSGIISQAKSRVSLLYKHEWYEFDAKTNEYLHKTHDQKGFPLTVRLKESDLESLLAFVFTEAALHMAYAEIYESGDMKLASYMQTRFPKKDFYNPESLFNHLSNQTGLTIPGDHAEKDSQGRLKFRFYIPHERKPEKVEVVSLPDVDLKDFFQQDTSVAIDNISWQQAEDLIRDLGADFCDTEPFLRNGLFDPQHNLVGFYSKQVTETNEEYRTPEEVDAEIGTYSEIDPDTNTEELDEIRKILLSTPQQVRELENLFETPSGDKLPIRLGSTNNSDGERVRTLKYNFGTQSVILGTWDPSNDGDYSGLTDTSGSFAFGMERGMKPHEGRHDVAYDQDFLFIGAKKYYMGSGHSDKIRKLRSDACLLAEEE
jgi:hypothetical protein